MTPNKNSTSNKIGSDERKPSFAQEMVRTMSLYSRGYFSSPTRLGRRVRRMYASGPEHQHWCIQSYFASIKKDFVRMRKRQQKRYCIYPPFSQPINQIEGESEHICSRRRRTSLMPPRHLARTLPSEFLCVELLLLVSHLSEEGEKKNEDMARTRFYSIWGRP